MARKPRIVRPHEPLHLVQRGNNRTTTFAASEDHVYFLDILHVASRLHGLLIHAYVLMSNHFHLLVTPEDERAPARVMEALGRRYVRYFNAREARTGTLWEGRFRSAVIDSDDYFFRCSQYIELNPVRAAMVASPEAYRWSSFGHNALGHPDRLITPHALYRSLAACTEERQLAYQKMVAARLELADLDRIRRATVSRTCIGGVPRSTTATMA